MTNALHGSLIEQVFRRDSKRPKDRIKWTGEYYIFNKSKRKVSERQLYGILASEVKRYEQAQEKLANKFLNGKISYKQWGESSAELIKRSHIDTARLVRGGKDNTPWDDYLDTGRDLQNHYYQAHKNLAAQVKNNEVTDKQFLQRVRGFAQANKITYEKIKQKKLAQENPARLAVRELGSCAPHCPECLLYATYGPLPIQDIIPPGTQCRCNWHCCCIVRLLPE
jgi:hypothetical protein